MLDEGQAKVRHVGAWAIRKVMEKGKKYVRQNINDGVIRKKTASRMLLN